MATEVVNEKLKAVQQTSLAQILHGRHGESLFGLV